MRGILRLISFYIFLFRDKCKIEATSNMIKETGRKFYFFTGDENILRMGGKKRVLVFKVQSFRKTINFKAHSS